MTPGLPPDASPGQFIGFDKDGFAYVLEWWPAMDGEPGCWGGCGMQRNLNSDSDSAPYHPLAFMVRGEMADFIVRHAPLPT